MGKMMMGKIFEVGTESVNSLQVVVGFVVEMEIVSTSKKMIDCLRVDLIEMEKVWNLLARQEEGARLKKVRLVSWDEVVMT